MCVLPWLPLAVHQTTNAEPLSDIFPVLLLQSLCSHGGWKVKERGGRQPQILYVWDNDDLHSSFALHP